MKYQNLKSFQKHLESAAPQHLCRMYLVAIQDDFERAKVLDTIVSLTRATSTRYSAAESDIAEILDAIHSMTLFGETVVVVDEVEKMAKKQMQIFCEHLAAPSGYVIFGTRSKVALSSIVEKEGVVFDLLEEKSWDKEKRLAEELIEQAKKSGKRLPLEAVHLLIERIGLDAASLQSELDKLICYTGDRGAISPQDIFQISAASKSSSLWQIAEEVIWEGKEFPSMDQTIFHGLIPALRSQLHLGLTLATFIEEKRPADEWSRYLPKIWPKVLEKRSSQAARFGSSYFRKGLEKLFEVELLSRMNSTQYRALLDLLRAQIHVR